MPSHRRIFMGALIVLVLLLGTAAIPGAGLFLLGAVVLTILWALGVVGQPPSRPCPRCGERVQTGVLDCPHCGFDFRVIGQVEEGTRP